MRFLTKDDTSIISDFIEGFEEGWAYAWREDSERAVQQPAARPKNVGKYNELKTLVPEGRLQRCPYIRTAPSPAP